MFQAFNAIDQITDAADESDEERAERLEERARELDLDPVTLFEAEEQTRNLALALKEEHAEGIGEFEDAPGVDDDLLAAIRPLLTMLGDDAETVLLGKALTKDPRTAANLVKSLDGIFDREGLYDELGTTSRQPGELRSAEDAAPVEEA